MSVDEILSAVKAIPGRQHMTNFYSDNGCCPLPTDTAATPAQRLERFGSHLYARWDAPIVLVGEAAGWRGTRQTGIPFTSPAQIGTGSMSEATATVVYSTLADLGLANDVLLWNACLLHPHKATLPNSNTAPRASVIDDCLELLEHVSAGRLVVAVGRHAERAVARVVRGPVVRPELASIESGAFVVRHPSFGGSTAFRSGMIALKKWLEN